MANPNIQLGQLNRLIASVTWNSFPQLNVSASFLNRAGIILAFEGDATRILPAMAGTVLSPEPYQMVTVTVNLLKTQSLAQAYEAQRQTSTPLGNGTIRPDATTLAPYQLINMAIEGVRELAFSGEDAGYAVTCRGYYLINSSLWS
jgi:hypothetical protein